MGIALTDWGLQIHDFIQLVATAGTDKREAPIGNRQSAIGNRQSAIVNRQCNRQSPIRQCNPQSSITNRHCSTSIASRGSRATCCSAR
ncbi:MAG: hypothetical protein FJW23_13360 [Acidimicrobiia bacterium]|nr:hypothetical protein [Acidimicrobiia bacterium]